MIRVTTNVNGVVTDHEISSMESLAKLQGYLTEEAIKNFSAEISEEQKEEIIHNYLQEAEHDFSMRADLVEEITNNMTNTYDDIMSHALADTDYDDIDEMVDAIESRDNALYDIYNIAGEYA